MLMTVVTAVLLYPSISSYWDIDRQTLINSTETDENKRHEILKKFMNKRIENTAIFIIKYIGLALIIVLIIGIFGGLQ